MISMDLLKALELLRSSQCVAIPTETVYGLAADATNSVAVAKIFTIKNRPTFDPLIIHLADSQNILQWVQEFPPLAQKLAEAFWPGPLTLVLPKKSIIPDLVSSGLPTVGVRVPRHPLTQQLLHLFGKPLAAPSANQFGRISPTTPLAVQKELGEQVPLILEGGPCEVGLESTIVSFPEGRPTILRLGGISLESIQEIVGEVALENRPQAKPQAPGQLAEHYAPRKRLRLVKTSEDLKRYENKNVGALVWGTEKGENFGKVLSLTQTNNWTEAAAHFFQMLRDLDESDVQELVALQLPEEGIARAINERLRRACFSAG